MAKYPKGFNFNGRRYTYARTGGMSLEYAKDRLEQRRTLAPDFLWVIHRTSDGTYGLGRAARKGKMANQSRIA